MTKKKKKVAEPVAVPEVPLISIWLPPSLRPLMVNTIADTISEIYCQHAHTHTNTRSHIVTPAKHGGIWWLPKRNWIRWASPPPKKRTLGPLSFLPKINQMKSMIFLLPLYYVMFFRQYGMCQQGLPRLDSDSGWKSIGIALGLQIGNRMSERERKSERETVIGLP